VASHIGANGEPGALHGVQSVGRMVSGYDGATTEAARLAGALHRMRNQKLSVHVACNWEQSWEQWSNLNKWKNPELTGHPGRGHRWQGRKRRRHKLLLVLLTGASASLSQGLGLRACCGGHSGLIPEGSFFLPLRGCFPLHVPLALFLFLPVYLPPGPFVNISFMTAHTVLGYSIKHNQA
jgi:hypothetical protein